MLKLAQESQLLIDENGNASVKLSDNAVAITPRGVDKSKLTGDDILLIQVDQEQRQIFVNSERKPSIDSSVSDALYKAFPGLKAIIHTHSPWSLNGFRTSFPYPCGVKEEAEEVIRAIKQNSYQDNNPFLVKLIHHGYILGLAGELTIDKLEEQWKKVNEDFKTHMAELSISEEELAGSTLCAMISSKGIIGYVLHHVDGTISPRILDEYRGLGLGRELFERLKEEDSIIKTIPECGVLRLYSAKGFETIKQDGRYHCLKAGSVQIRQK